MNNPFAATFGQTLINILNAEHGEEATLDFVELLTSGTLPGTAQRAAQDKAWSKITSRLIAAVPKPEPTPAPSASTMTSKQIADASVV